MKFISGVKTLPSKSEMLNDMQKQAQILWDKGYEKRRYYFLQTPEEKAYYKQLSEAAEIQTIPDCRVNIVADLRVTPFKDVRTFKYTIIDDKHFIKEKYED